MSEPRPLQRLEPEAVAYWFFRLNGCLTITNFMLHSAHRRGEVHTDGDIVAVRFPHRIELEQSRLGAMDDHRIFRNVASAGKTLAAFVEVKAGRDAPAQLNDRWRDPQTHEEFIKRIGPVPDHVVPQIAASLVQTGRDDYAEFALRIFTVSWHRSSELFVPIEQQLLWREDIFAFIHERFVRYHDYKTAIAQWDRTGKRLFEIAFRYRRDAAAFSDVIAEMISIVPSSKHTR